MQNSAEARILYFLFGLLFLPPGSTAFVFVTLAQPPGKEWDDVPGFLFYDDFWCLLIPLLLLLSTTTGAFGMLSAQFLAHTPWLLVAITIR
jgi:hypothetical protein